MEALTWDPAQAGSVSWLDPWDVGYPEVGSLGGEKAVPKPQQRGREAGTGGDRRRGLGNPLHFGLKSQTMLTSDATRTAFTALESAALALGVWGEALIQAPGSPGGGQQVGLGDVEGGGRCCAESAALSSCSANTSGWWGRAGILNTSGEAGDRNSPLCPSPFPAQDSRRENWARQEGERGVFAH